MVITRRALKKLDQLKRKQGRNGETAVRLGRNESGVFLKWETLRRRDGDLTLSKRGLPVVIDARSYLQLADCVLDFESGAAGRGFFLRRNVP